MKKTIFSVMFAMVLGITFGSCGKTAGTASDVDSTAVDSTVVVDTLAVDSAVVDTACVD